MLNNKSNKFLWSYDLNIIKIGFSLFFLFLIFNLFADEFKIKNFRKEDNCLDARLNKYKRLDDNDEACAIIKIRTSFEGLKVSAYPPIIGNVPYIKGEYWVYVSPGTRQISFYGKGINKVDYNIPVKINSYDVFIMDIEAVRYNTENLINKLGNLFIVTNPPGASISLNNNPTGKLSPFHYTPLEGIQYLQIYKPGYYIVDTNLKIVSGGIYYLNINLKKKKNTHLNQNTSKTLDVKLISNNILSKLLFIDGEQEELTNKQKVVKLSSGDHLITLMADCFKPIDTLIKVNENKTVILNPEKICGELFVETNPPSDIFIDKEKEGNGKITLNLFEGNHLVEAIGEDLNNYRTIVYIKKNKTDSLSIKLKKLKATLSIQTTPMGAVVFLDDSMLGNTPVLMENINKGKHRLIVKKQGFGTIVENIHIDYPITYNINKALKPGRLIELKTSPDSAKLYINDILIGNSPQTIELPLQTIQILVKKKGYPNLIDSINVKTCKDEISYDLSFKAHGPEMVYVNGNCYKRRYGWTDFNVCVSSFYISKNEVTNKDFCMYLNDIIKDEVVKNKITKTRTYGRYIIFDQKEENYKVKNGFENYPINFVSWNMAENYCKWQGGRLPTEAEWEYAARGKKNNNNYKYSGSDEIDEVAWYKENSGDQVHKVKMLKSNALGIYDMSGNVNEWCYDWFQDNYFVNSPSQNPTGPKRGFYKVVRGGGFSDKKKAVQLYYRRSAKPETMREDIGFRLVKLDF